MTSNGSFRSLSSSESRLLEVSISPEPRVVFDSLPIIKVWHFSDVIESAYSIVLGTSCTALEHNFPFCNVFVLDVPLADAPVSSRKM